MSVPLAYTMRRACVPNEQERLALAALLAGHERGQHCEGAASFSFVEGPDGFGLFV